MSSVIDEVMDKIPLRPTPILELGTGYGRFGLMIRFEKLPQFIVGVDLFRHHLQRLSRIKVYDGLVRCDASLLPFKSSCFKIVLAIAILEHLEKKKGIRMLREIERVGSEWVILATPNGWQPETPIDIDINPWGHHVSGWLPEELKAFGYKVRGLGFCSPLHMVRPPPLRRFILNMLFVITWMIPSFSQFLLCTKEIRGFDYA